MASLKKVGIIKHFQKGGTYEKEHSLGIDGNFLSGSGVYGAPIYDARGNGRAH
jgi:hypothetical protein